MLFVNKKRVKKQLLDLPLLFVMIPNEVPIIWESSKK